MSIAQRRYKWTWHRNPIKKKTTARGHGPFRNLLKSAYEGIWHFWIIEEATVDFIVHLWNNRNTNIDWSRVNFPRIRTFSINFFFHHCLLHTFSAPLPQGLRLFSFYRYGHFSKPTSYRSIKFTTRKNFLLVRVTLVTSDKSRSGFPRMRDGLVTEPRGFFWY